MEFVQRMVDSNMDLWNGYLKHPFIKEMAAGTLSEEKMKWYIIEDSLYLREYAKVFAVGMQKSPRMEDLSRLNQMVAGIVEGEWVTRDQYLQRFGLKKGEWERFSPSKPNQDYTTYMLKIAMAGGLPEIMAATLPCKLSYGFIGHALVKQNPRVLKGKYGALIYDYACKDYADSCITDGEYMESLCVELSNERKQRLYKIFRQASIYEMRFWDMAYAGRVKANV